MQPSQLKPSLRRSFAACMHACGAIETRMRCHHADPDETIDPHTTSTDHVLHRFIRRSHSAGRKGQRLPSGARRTPRLPQGDERRWSWSHAPAPAPFGEGQARDHRFGGQGEEGWRRLVELCRILGRSRRSGWMGK